LTDYVISFGACVHEINFSRVGIFIEMTINVIISFIIYF